MRKLVAGLAVLTAMAATPAFSRNIGFISADLAVKTQRVILVDLDTVDKIAGGEARMWSYQYARLENGQKWVVVSLDLYNCAEKKSRALSRKYFDTSGDYKFDEPVSNEWNYAVPSSVRDQLTSCACGIRVPEGENIVGDVDPFKVIQLFIDSGTKKD